MPYGTEKGKSPKEQCLLFMMDRLKGIKHLCHNTSVFDCSQMTVKEISERISSIIEITQVLRN